MPFISITNPVTYNPSLIKSHIIVIIFPTDCLTNRTDGGCESATEDSPAIPADVLAHGTQSAVVHQLAG